MFKENFYVCRAAVNVELHDENFAAQSFEYAAGFESVKWPKIASGQNVTHTAIVRPKASGLFNFTHATVTYLVNEKSDRVQVSSFISSMT